MRKKIKQNIPFISKTFTRFDECMMNDFIKRGFYYFHSKKKREKEKTNSNLTLVS